MIAADAQFRAAANAAAAAYAQAPAYLTYRTDVTVDIPSLNQHKVIARAVETRTGDDLAVLQDLPQGRRQYAHSFPLIPTFDALSYFHLSYNGSRRDALSYVQMLQPITFSDAPSHSDVVVTYLRYYHASYAPDTTDAIAHLVMEPLSTLTNGNKSDFYLHDVYVDTASNLPTRVVYAGPDTDFTVDYVVVQNHWLVSHVVYARTMYALLHIARLHFTVDATNSNFGFPAAPTDARLAGTPVPTAAPHS